MEMMIRRDGVEEEHVAELDDATLKTDMMMLSMRLTSKIYVKSCSTIYFETNKILVTCIYLLEMFETSSIIIDIEWYPSQT